MNVKRYSEAEADWMIEVGYTTTAEDLKNLGGMSDEEYASYFNEYKKVCDGCQLMHDKCNDTSVIMCYLRRLLPHGVWSKASMNDIVAKNGEDMANEINKRIVEKIMKERKQK